MASRSAMSATTICMLASILGMLLVGCQSAELSQKSNLPEMWHVLERMGDVRSTNHALRPGDLVADGEKVTTGKSALLILAKEGVQLTAGEHSVVRLPTTIDTSDLRLERGWLRVRLTRPIDQQLRMRTAQFDITASNAVLTLRAGPDNADLTIEEGSAVLATKDGRHRVTLIAGAAARQNAASGNNLVVRHASESDFARVAPLAELGPEIYGEPRQRYAESGSASVDHSIIDGRGRAGFPKERPLAILPASRLTNPAGHVRQAIDGASFVTEPATSPSTGGLRSEPAHLVPITEPVVPSSLSYDLQNPSSANPTSPQNASTDPIQHNFDLLTEGLVDGL